MSRTSEKKHWDDFWASSQELDDVYGTDSRIVEHLRAHVDFAGLKVLEVGAGTGRDAAAIAAEGAHTVTLDYSPQSLDLMRRNFGDRFSIICGDAMTLPFADASFDVVFHQGLLEHFRNPGDMVTENARLLKPGGILLIDVPQRYHYYTVAKHILIAVGKWFAGWETEFSVAELRRLMESRGLTIVDVYGHNQSPPIWYRGIRRVLLKAGVRLPMYPKAPAPIGRLGDFFRRRVPQKLFVNTAMVIGCLGKKGETGGASG